jgi:hypothetical protein
MNVRGRASSAGRDLRLATDGLEIHACKPQVTHLAISRGRRNVVVIYCEISMMEL